MTDNWMKRENYGMIKKDITMLPLSSLTVLESRILIQTLLCEESNERAQNVQD